MAFLRLEDAAAVEVWENVKAHLHLLRHASSLHPTNANPQHELEVITFLANMGFGESDVLARRGTTREQYFADLHHINSDIFMLHYGNESLTIELKLGNRVPERLELGLARGYSTVSCLSERGHAAYMGNEVSAFQFTEQHIIHQGVIFPDPCYIYGEGLFHVGALTKAYYFKRRGRIRNISVEPPFTIMPGLFRHIGRFMPRIGISDNGRKITTSPDIMPKVIFADNGWMADQLIARGFEAPRYYPEKGIAGYPRYVLDLSVYNDPELPDAKRKSLSKLVNAYRRSLKNGTVKTFATDTTKIMNTTRTVLFTDIYKSTEKLTEWGNAKWLDFIREHGGDIKKWTPQFTDEIPKSTGDGYLVTFASAEGALRCAAGFSTILAPWDLEVKCGLHTGDVGLFRGDGTPDAYGLIVHIASRVAALAKPGEILVTRTVYDAVQGSKLTFAERGYEDIRGTDLNYQMFSFDPTK